MLHGLFFVWLSLPVLVCKIWKQICRLLKPNRKLACSFTQWANLHNKATFAARKSFSNLYICETNTHTHTWTYWSHTLTSCKHNFCAMLELQCFFRYSNREEIRNCVGLSKTQISVGTTWGQQKSGNSLIFLNQKQTSELSLPTNKKENDIHTFLKLWLHCPQSTPNKNRRKILGSAWSSFPIRCNSSWKGLFTQPDDVRQNM